MRSPVRPKKHLGQHFLLDETVSERIAASLSGHLNYKNILEIGPGTGALTKYLLLHKQFHVECVEVDVESIGYLATHYPDLKVHGVDFLAIDLPKFGPFVDGPVAVTGNFPYNISSQILFKIYDHHDLVPEAVGMFQKEVAKRIAAGPGSKTYGILSVLLQAYYDIDYLFTVPPDAFDPPPKVESGVIRLKRNETSKLECDEKFFKVVVKAAFNQRRKTLRNAVKAFLPPDHDIDPELLGKRAEQLSVDQFVVLTNALRPS